MRNGERAGLGLLHLLRRLPRLGLLVRTGRVGSPGTEPVRRPDPVGRTQFAHQRARPHRRSRPESLRRLPHLRFPTPHKPPPRPPHDAERKPQPTPSAEAEAEARSRRHEAEADGASAEAEAQAQAEADRGHTPKPRPKPSTPTAEAKAEAEAEPAARPKPRPRRANKPNASGGWWLRARRCQLRRPHSTVPSAARVERTPLRPRPTAPLRRRSRGSWHRRRPVDALHHQRTRRRARWRR